MKCIVCGRAEHMSLSSWFVPTTDKRLHIHFVTCGDCLDTVASLDRLPVGNYTVEMTVMDVT